MWPEDRCLNYSFSFSLFFLNFYLNFIRTTITINESVWLLLFAFCFRYRRRLRSTNESQQQKFHFLNHSQNKLKMYFNDDLVSWYHTFSISRKLRTTVMLILLPLIHDRFIQLYEYEYHRVVVTCNIRVDFRQAKKQQGYICIQQPWCMYVLTWAMWRYTK